MYSYYDSDDDVAWGPLTLREIKRTLKNPTVRKVERRHTLQTMVKTLTHCNEETKSQGMHTDESTPVSKEIKCNITSSSNEYFTPNATMNDKNCLPGANSSQYMPNLKDKLIVASDQNMEDTQRIFLDLAKNRATEFDLKNVQQTLVESTVLNHSLDNDKNEDSYEMHDSCLMNSTDSSKQSQIFDEDDIIVLSSDDENDSFVIAQAIPSQNVDIKNKLFKKEIIEFDESFCENNKNNINNENYSESGSEKYLADNITDISYEEINDTSEESLSASSIMENHLETPTGMEKNITVGGEGPRSYADISPVQVPKIDLAAFDESDDCLKLNDTLEEIERMLIAGNDSSSESDCSQMPSEDSSVVSSQLLHLPTSSKLLQSPVHIISGSFSQSPSHLNVDKGIIQSTFTQTRKPIPSKLKTPTKVCCNFNIDKATVSSAVKIDRKQEVMRKIPTPGQFRIPKTPGKPKTGFINSNKIVSPVATYIKYSTKSPLITHLKPKEQIKRVPISQVQQPQKVVQNNKENFDILPPVVYKPAKNKLYTMKEQLFLPASIDKMVKKSNVVKHEKRFQLGSHDQNSVERKLSTETELTKNTISDSLLDDTNNQDVSVLASRPAFQK